ncbi:MAG: hypothetical protein LC122_12025 [Chitinophagales bacterium]|nr:hypothetical protein [Chitinophagales bacterium]
MSFIDIVLEYSTNLKNCPICNLPLITCDKAKCCKNVWSNSNSAFVHFWSLYGLNEFNNYNGLVLQKEICYDFEKSRLVRIFHKSVTIYTITEYDYTTLQIDADIINNAKSVDSIFNKIKLFLDLN